MNSYQQDALQFALPTAFTMEYLIPALAEEAGEVCGLYAKHVRAGLADNQLDKDKLKKELGDVLWGISCIAAYHGMPLQDVADANIAKLTKRRSEGTIAGGLRND
jgi:NTP pyrophosphatase (non-canonical NTP hydrolase)